MLKNTSVNITGDAVRISVPFSKVDTEKRIVHGFATLDNVDNQDDIVLYEASKSAFEKFRGNIREMHALKAVGKMVSFRPERLYSSDTDEVYNGIFVSTYVSKGAQDTWEKVIDGTLTGFSIGGEIKKSSNRFDEENDKLIRVIEEYEITELSLVDNPANQLANVVSFEKGVQSGYIANTKTENIFYCRLHNVVQFTDEPRADCHQCGAEMVNIGFVESDDPGKIGIVKKMIDGIRNAPYTGDMVEFDEGFGMVDAVVMNGEVFLPDSDEKAYKATEVNPIAIISIYDKNDDTIIKTEHRIVKNLSSIKKMKEVEVATEVDETTEPVVEETAEVVETEETTAEAPVEEVIQKSEISEIKEMLDGITKALAAIPEALQAVANSTASTKEKLVELEEVAKSATADLAKANKENEELGKRVEAVESATAFRKSADVGEIVQAAPEVQSIWGGRFLDGSTNRL